MNEIQTGGRAFPVPDDASDMPGMTLRDYFAAKAMQGLLSSDVVAPLDDFAAKSYLVADAMLNARKEIK